MKQLNKKAYDYAQDNAVKEIPSSTSIQAWAFKDGASYILDTEVKRLKSVLEIYADKKNWSHPKIYKDGSRQGKSIIEMMQYAIDALKER